MSGSVMTYEQFINLLISKIEIQNPGCGVRLRSSKKKNCDKKDLLIVHTTIRDISLYPQSLYDDYLMGVATEDVLAEFVLSRIHTVVSAK